MMFPSIPGYSVTPTQCGEKVNSRHPSKNIYIYLYIPPGVELIFEEAGINVLNKTTVLGFTV